MKKILLLTIAVLMVSQGYSQSNPQKTIITGYIPDLADTVVTVEYSTMQLLDLNNPTEICKTDLNKGRFAINLNQKHPTDIQLKINDRKIFLFPLGSILIEPGDSIHVDIPDFKKTAFLDVKFSGKGFHKLTILQDIWRPVMTLPKKFVVMNTIYTFKENYFLPQIKQIKMIDSAFQANRSQLDDKVYKILRIQTLSRYYGDIMSNLASFIDNDTISILYKKYIQNQNFKEEFADTETFPYRNTPPIELTYLALLDYGFKNKIKVNTVDLPLFYTIISVYYKEYEEVKNYILATKLIAQMKQFGLKGDTEKTVQRFLADIPSGIFHKQVLDRYHSVRANNTKGTPFFNFELEDSTGKMVKLSDFRGKNIFIDFYFNGCGPCKLLVPTVKTMEEKYKKKNIVFISISVDASKKLWINGRGIFSSPTSIQLYTNGEGIKHPLYLYAGILGCPATFLIDKEGKIFEANLSHIPEEMSASISKLVAEKLK